MGVRKRMREEVSFRNVSASKTMKLDLSTENEVIELESLTPVKIS